MMTIARLIRNNLVYYFRKNLLLAAGVAVSGAVLTGALLVGDSVEYSLNRIVELRLGKVTHVIQAGDRFFTTDLAAGMREELGVPVSAMLMQEGMAVADGGNRRINQVQVTGVDANFDHMAGMEGYYRSLSGDSIIISANLASRLNLGKGDELLLRIEKASLIPLNAPFVSDAGGTVSLRAYISSVAGEAQLGNFNLKVSQTAPFNIFISLARLEELMEFHNRVNVILIDAEGAAGTGQIEVSLRDQFTPYDAGLKIEYLEQSEMLEVTSHRVFIDEVLADHIFSFNDSARGIITYFVNSISRDTLLTPYSFVSTLPAMELRPGEVIINRWLSEDVGAVEGDSIGLSFFVVGPLRELGILETNLRVKSVVPIEDRFADGGLMPDLPGLSDAGNCRDWDTGVPIELEAIRDKDEDYWDRYAGIPKAFISIDEAKELWTNRFGTFTAIRIPVSPADAQSMESEIMEGFDPATLGFTLQETRTRGFEAAGEGVDFTELFAGLSFFLLVAGVLLTVLLFLLNLESRYQQLGTLVVMGIPLKIIRRSILVEGMAVAVAGALAGLALSVVYNRLVFMAMNGVWKDVVRTEMMFMEIRPGTLATGLILTLAISLAALYFPLNRNLKKRFRTYRTGERGKGAGRWLPAGIHQMRWLMLSTLISGLAALAMISSQLIRTEVVNASVFFVAGGLLLLSSIFFFLWFMGRLQEGSGRALSLSVLSLKNAIRNRTRSMSILLLFAMGAFLVISTGSNRKDLFRNAAEPSSGTGGFLYFAESTVPVLRNLNDPSVRTAYGLEGNYSFVQFRRASGDDASCLNLNRIVNPQVLGVAPGRLEGRFSFVTKTGYLDEEDPWGSLDRQLPGGSSPP